MIFSYVVCIRLKKIEIDQSSIFIYGLKKSDIIQLSEIKGVGGSVFWVPEFAWIKFTRPTKFGRIIFFLPGYQSLKADPRYLKGFSPHPIVAELKELIRKMV